MDYQVRGILGSKVPLGETTQRALLEEDAYAITLAETGNLFPQVVVDGALTLKTAAVSKALLSKHGLPRAFRMQLWKALKISASLLAVAVTTNLDSLDGEEVDTLPDRPKLASSVANKLLTRKAATSDDLARTTRILGLANAVAKTSWLTGFVTTETPLTLVQQILTEVLAAGKLEKGRKDAWSHLLAIHPGLLETYVASSSPVLHRAVAGSAQVAGREDLQRKVLGLDIPVAEIDGWAITGAAWNPCISHELLRELRTKVQDSGVYVAPEMVNALVNRLTNRPYTVTDLLNESRPDALATMVKRTLPSTYEGQVTPGRIEGLLPLLRNSNLGPELKEMLVQRALQGAMGMQWLIDSYTYPQVLEFEALVVEWAANGQPSDREQAESLVEEAKRLVTLFLPSAVEKLDRVDPDHTLARSWEATELSPERLAQYADTEVLRARGDAIVAYLNENIGDNPKKWLLALTTVQDRFAGSLAELAEFTNLLAID